MLSESEKARLREYARDEIMRDASEPGSQARFNDAQLYMAAIRRFGLEPEKKDER